MRSYKLRMAKFEKTLDGKDQYFLTYHRGSDEAQVVVTEATDRLSAKCEKLPADSHMDEMVLERLALIFVKEHGTGFGDVGKL